MVWCALFFCGMFLGWSLLRYLTVHPLQMGWFAWLSSLSLFLIVYLLSNVKGTAIGVSSLLALSGMVLGYLLECIHFLNQDEQCSLQKITRQMSDPGLGHTAVIYITHGEPPTFDPSGWLNQFREFDEKKVAFIPFLARPFFIYKLRQAYLKVGRSNHRIGHQRMIQRLSDSFLDQDHGPMRFYLSFLDDLPHPEAVVVQALNEGASRLVIAEIFVTVSNHTAEGEQLVRSVHPENFVPVSFSRPLWDSDTLREMFVVKANAARGDCDRRDVGIILVGHGQPDKWDREFPSETEQETCFREGITDLLVVDGYLRENIGLSWMEFKNPKPSTKVLELASRGVKKILYFSAAISADSLHSQYDVPELIAKARIPSDVEVINLGAWNDHPYTIRAIRERIMEALGDASLRERDQPLK